MIKKSSNPYYHIAYWIFVIVVLTSVFGLSWRNKTGAFFFVSMLLPIVLGTSYFFNYVLVPKYFIKRKFWRFGIYTLYTVIVSLYLETLVIIFSFIYLGHFNLFNLDPNAFDSVLLAVILYLLVFMGSFLLMLRQIRENRQTIMQLIDENNKMKKPFLEIMSNRKISKIPFADIIFIESLSDYVQIITRNEKIVSKEKISHLESRLPDIFLRIHRSFIINTEKIRNVSHNEVMLEDICLTIGRSYRKTVKESLNLKGKQDKN